MIEKTAIDSTDDTSEALGEDDIEFFRERSIAGAVSYTMRSVLLYGIGLITAFVLGSYFGPEQFAIYGIVTQLVGLLQFFSDVGLGPTLIQQDAKPSTRDYRVVFTMQQLLSWVIFLATIGIAWSGVLDQNIGTAGSWILIALGASFPLSSLKTIPAIIIERKLDFSKLVIPAIFEQIVYNVLLIYLVVNGSGVIAYAYAIAARSVIGVIVMYYLQSWSLGFSMHLATIKRVIGTGVKFQVTDLLAKLKDNLYYLVLGTMWLEGTQFGYIQFSKQWSHVPYMLTVQNVIAITFPAYSRLQGHPERLSRAIEKTIFFISVTIFPMLVGMSVFIDPLTHVVPSYEKWQPTIPTFILFTLSIGWAAISTPLTNTLNAMGDIDITMKLMIMWTTLTWLMTPFFLNWFGFEGVALAAFVIALTSVIPVFIVQKKLPVKIWQQVWQPFIAAVVMAAVAVALLPLWRQSIWYMLGGMILSGGVYVLVLLAIAWRKLIHEALSLIRGKPAFDAIRIQLQRLVA